MGYVIYFLIVYSSILGWIANKKEVNGQLTREDKDSLNLTHMLVFYAGSSIQAITGNTLGAFCLFVIASILNFISIEVYWYRYRENISKILNSFWLKIISVFSLSVITSGAVLLSGMILEEITFAPSSSINNLVIVFSIMIIISVSLILAIFIIELGAFSFFLYYFLRQIKGYRSNFDVIFNVILLPLPIFVMFTVYSNFLFDSSLIKKGLFYLYHSNEKKVCTNIDSKSRFLPISGTEISSVEYDKEKEKYIFTIEICKMAKLEDVPN